jgi:hypothetical protein
MAFWALPEHVQAFWLEHAENHLSGAYEAPAAAADAPGAPAPADPRELAAWTAQAIREAKARGVLTADGYDPTRARG